ncbi:YdcF family protein [Paraburkholderia saeva]|uniref:YdcF family protein n=1 Tax=Paraburkholderia saeva TaxID=2777537 RepID=UPI001E2E251A|nr:YdcF family protein [Paraburkholderia saeva]
MILFTLLALFFAAFLLWRRQRSTVLIIALALFWLLSSGWLTAPLLAWAQHGAHPVARATFSGRAAIVMLGSGTEYDANGRLIPKRDAIARIEKTAAIYADCTRVAARCDVIVSGGNPQRHEATEADTYLPWLLARGVARNDVVLENRSLTTYENAKRVVSILQREHYDSTILVTSAHQMPRALLDFHRFGCFPQPVISNTRRAHVGVLPRYINLVNADIALHELIGIAQFRVYHAIGWF